MELAERRLHVLGRSTSNRTGSSKGCLGEETVAVDAEQVVVVFAARSQVLAPAVDVPGGEVLPSGDEVRDDGR